MKIRQGFVSNSSSSSFIILGYDITKEESLELIKNNSEHSVLCWDEETVYDIYSEEMLNDVGSGVTFYKSFYWGDVDAYSDFNEIKLEDLKIPEDDMKKMKIIFGERLT